MNIIRKIIKGSDLRKSRLHDEKGNFIDFNGIFNLPNAVLSGFLRLLFNKRIEVPWISYQATIDIAKLMTPNWNVLEFGSGSSTIWFANRCKHLISIENDENWYRLISCDLKKYNISNVTYELRSNDKYTDLSMIDDFSLDFVLIDGFNRFGCILQVINKVKKGGYLYLDNSDKYANDPRGDVRMAEDYLINIVNERAGKLKYYVDFAPSQFFVNQGLLVQL